MKYSKRFEEDFELYWRLRHTFTFAPYDPLKGKKPIDIVPHMSVKKAFFKFDTHGKYYNISDSEELLRVITTKASINFHIKQYAIDRSRGWMSSLDLLDLQKEFSLPQWFVDAVEKQKCRLYRTPISLNPCNV
jgi:hypothetical protein